MNRSRFIVGTAVLALLVCAGMASAQTAANITVVSGNGQLICPAICVGADGRFFSIVVAKVTDANGNPVPMRRSIGR